MRIFIYYFLLLIMLLHINLVCFGQNTPKRVLAFYYPWYGNPEYHLSWFHWENVDTNNHSIGSSTNYPAIGAYDSHNPKTIAYHIKLAKRYGIDGFICSWWGVGGFEDKAIPKLLDYAQKKNFEITLYWESVPGEGEKKIVRAVSDLVYILKNYGSHPAFMKIDNKPVIFIYSRVMGQIKMNEWSQIIEKTKNQYQNDFDLIADGLNERNAKHFEGIHTYSIAGWAQNKSLEELKAQSKNLFGDAVKIARKFNKISCVTIIPGYDDRKIRKPGINAERYNGEAYKAFWENTIEANPDWILITSWNEWHEGSEIEPSLEYESKYLKITKEYADIFKEGK